MKEAKEPTRLRDVNWDEADSQLLCTILKEYSKIIEDKSMDTNSNKKKRNAWKELHRRFNEISSKERTLVQLQTRWKVMKGDVKKACTTFKKEINKTGGGCGPAAPSQMIQQVADMLHPAELLRDNNIYDSDGSYGMPVEPTGVELETPITDLEPLTDIYEITIVSDTENGDSNGETTLTDDAEIEYGNKNKDVVVEQSVVKATTPSISKKRKITSSVKSCTDDAEIGNEEENKDVVVEPSVIKATTPCIPKKRKITNCVKSSKKGN